MDTLITVENLSKKFCKDLKSGLWYGVKDLTYELLGSGNQQKSNLRRKEFWAVDQVSFSLKRGECLGIIGANGAGKSTLLKMLNGLIKPDIGRIEIKGRVGALIELGAGFNPILTGVENIYINGAVLGFTKREIDEKLEAIIDFAEIGDFINTPVQYYSSGMKVRLGFAVASQMEPDVLIIDEVLAVGDVAFRVKCYNKIFELLKKAAVIFVSHSMSQVARICSHVTVMSKGRVVFYGEEVGSGIGKYFETLSSTTTASVQDSGLAAINDVHYEDSSSTGKVQSVDYMAALTICVSYILKQEFEEISFLIVFKNEEQVPVAQISSAVDNQLLAGLESGVDKSCAIHLDKFRLNPGKYTMTISLIEGRRGNLLYVVRDSYEITVRGSSVGYAPILLDAKWVM